MSDPLAYFLTWTCYGQRLHGDSRGTVDRDHNLVGHDYLEEDVTRLRGDRDRLKHGVVSLSNPMRAVCRATIEAHCRIRKWRLLTQNVRTTHIHVVVDCRGKYLPEDAMEQFKAWCTRKLREEGLIEPDRPVWTEHGSTRWLNDDESVMKAVDYVTRLQ